MSLFASLKKFDIYRDVPKDLTEQTITGALVSVFCGIMVVYLFFSEFLAFLTVETVSEMYVDPVIDHSAHSTILIRMNITVPRLPCAVCSIDVQDIMGSHIVDYGGKLHKYRTTADGTIKLSSRGAFLAHDASQPPLDQKGEGCNIEGTLIVKQVPGNFHISSHAHQDLLPLFYNFHGGENLNLTHEVHHLSFGGAGTDQLAQDVGAESVAVSPLNGARQVAIMEPEDGGAPRSYEYFLKVVPSKLVRLSGEEIDSFQYVSNSNFILGRFQIPAIYFRYDFSPLTVKFVQKRNSLAHFLVQVCAIVGGVFTVLGLVNGALVAASKKFKKGIGKLG